MLILVDGKKGPEMVLNLYSIELIFFLILEATNSKLTVPEVLRGGDTTSCKQKNCPIESVPSSQDDERSKGNGNFSIRTNFSLFFQ